MRRIALADADGEAEISLGVLVKLRDHAKAEGIRFAAATEIKNTIWGKPRQALEHTGQGGGPIITKELNLPNLTPDVLKKLAIIAIPEANGNGHVIDPLAGPGIQ